MFLTSPAHRKFAVKFSSVLRENLLTRFYVYRFRAHLTHNYEEKAVCHPAMAGFSHATTVGMGIWDGWRSAAMMTGTLLTSYYIRWPWRFSNLAARGKFVDKCFISWQDLDTVSVQHFTCLAKWLQFWWYTCHLQIKVRILLLMTEMVHDIDPELPIISYRQKTIGPCYVPPNADVLSVSELEW